MSRPSRGWARSKCPIHGGDNPTAFSVNVETGAFYCFNCGAKGGDLVAFLRTRYGLTFKDAAKQLGAWDETSKVPSAQLARIREERELQRRIEAARMRQAQRERLEIRWRLHSMERLYGKTNSRLSQLLRGAPERFRGELETAWWLLSYLLPRIREADAAYRKAAGIGGEA